MALIPKRFMHQPLYVDAVQVTQDNMAEVSEWCDGVIRKTGDKPYVKVPVTRPQRDRQAQAFVGDWVIKGGMGWKVYTASAMTKMFIEIPEGTSTNTAAKMFSDSTPS
jgi:hypothetical protein